MAYFNTQSCNAVSVRLDETNYPTWFFQMFHYLRGHGLLKFVNGSHPCPSQFHIANDVSPTSENSKAYERWLEQDSSLILMITNTLSAEALTLVIGCKTSMEVWLTLKQRYAIVSEVHIMQLKATLQNIEKGSESIEKYLLRFKSIRDRLTAAGVSMSDQDAKFLILAGLPGEYGHTRQIIRGKHDITMDEVRSLLLSAEFEIELVHKALPLSSFIVMAAQNSMTLLEEIQWNGSRGVASPYNCLVSTGSRGVASPYNCLVSTGITSPNAPSIGYQSAFNTNAMMNNGIFSNGTYVSECGSIGYQSAPYSSTTQQNVYGCFSQPTGFIAQNGRGITQNSGSMQVPYGGAISQLHDGCSPQNSVFSQQHFQSFCENVNTCSLNDPYSNATENPPFGEGQFLETNDLSNPANPVEPNSAGFDMLDEYLTYFDADDDISQYIDFDSCGMLGNENIVPSEPLVEQKFVTGETEPLYCEEQKYFDIPEHYEMDTKSVKVDYITSESHDNLKFFNLSEYYETESKVVKDEYYVEQSHNPEDVSKTLEPTSNFGFGTSSSELAEDRDKIFYGNTREPSCHVITSENHQSAQEEMMEIDLVQPEIQSFQITREEHCLRNLAADMENQKVVTFSQEESLGGLGVLCGAKKPQELVCSYGEENHNDEEPTKLQDMIAPDTMKSKNRKTTVTKEYSEDQLGGLSFSMVVLFFVSLFLLLLFALIKFATADDDFTLMSKHHANRNKIEDKVIWITGASRGIGEILAKQLANLGAKLIISSCNSEAELERVKKQLTSKHAPDGVKISGEDWLKDVVEKAESYFTNVGVDYMTHSNHYAWYPSIWLRGDVKGSIVKSISYIFF